MIKRNTVKMAGLTAALTLALAACGDNPFGPNPRDVEFAEELGINLDAMTETESGLFIRDDVLGEGEPSVAGDRLTFTFTAWLVDGEVFDSGEVTFTIPNELIAAGLNEGLLGIRVGGTRTIVIPAELGFGSSGGEGVPDDAVLIYEVTLTGNIRGQT
jgi:FKBP-type peptidyl-prolyl cis-trans isomerase FkpA